MTASPKKEKDTALAAAVFKNVSSSGARWLPLLGDREIAAGEEFEVTPEQAAALYDQPDVWECVSGLELFEHLMPTTEPIDEPESEGEDA